MKKVLFFMHSLIGGGAEKTVLNLAKYMNENLPDVEAYICVVYDDERMHAETQNVIVLKNKTIPTMIKIRKIPIIAKQIIELKKIKKSLNIDVCISLLPGADFLNVASRNKEKVVVSVRNKESFFIQSIFKKWYIQYTYRHSDCIVAVAKRVKMDVVHYFGAPEEKVKVIYNPVPSFVLQGEIKKEFQVLLQTKKIVINVGRLTEQKGQGYLIRAFKEVVREVDNAHLVILGIGELNEELHSLIRDLKMEDHVTLLGFVYNPQDYLQNSEVFVLSSIVEGIANILLETLSCNTAIVSTDCDSGPREILAPETDCNQVTSGIEHASYGILVPVCGGDSFSRDAKLSEQELLLAQAIVEMIQDDNLRAEYQRRSHQRIADFEIESIVKQWMEIIG